MLIFASTAPYAIVCIKKKIAAPKCSHFMVLNFLAFASVSGGCSPSWTPLSKSFSLAFSTTIPSVGTISDISTPDPRQRQQAAFQQRRAARPHCPLPGACSWTRRGRCDRPLAAAAARPAPNLTHTRPSLGPLSPHTAGPCETRGCRRRGQRSLATGKVIR